jgi:hypothetical protein
MAYVWVHGAIEGAGEEFALGVERGVYGGGEAVWKSSLVGYFEGCVLGGESCGGWVESLAIKVLSGGNKNRGLLQQSTGEA